ncbi:MAG: sulfatase [Anaerolineae bacterium]|nr:sulfatase [Anaerolineae bacterium]
MAQRPNVIFILIDDLGWRDLTSYGSTFYETPHLDKLAAEGVVFTDAYAACPVCSPTRASILSGKYPATVGVTDWIDWAGVIHPARGRVIDAPYIKHLPQREYSLARALREHGYATWHVGKWHLGGEGYLPTDHGFEVNVGGCEWGSPGRMGYFSPWGIPPLRDAPVPEGTYLTDYLTDRAIELIENKDERPFFLNLWYYTVHTPIEAKKEKIAKYEEKAHEMGLDKVKALEEGEFFPCEHKKHLRVVRRLIQSDPVYAAMVESLDENIGRLLQALERTGEAENTIVIFTSDNGGLATAEGSPTSNAPLAEGKGWMYEGGTREPLIIRWPGVTQPGQRISVPVTSPDFYPTILEMVGLPLLPWQHTDGVSFVPLLRGAEQLEREAIYWHYPHYGNQGGTPGSSLRMGDYKLIEFFEDGHIELYNLREDISEDHNIAGDEPERARMMKEMLVEWRAKVGAKLPEPNPDYRP